MIPPDGATPNVVKNLLDDYGTISYEAILAEEQTYIDTDCRGTQDTHMLYECIMNSLTDEGRAKLNIDDDMYTVGTNERMSGACLLKIPPGLKCNVIDDSLQTLQPGRIFVRN